MDLPESKAKVTEAAERWVQAYSEPFSERVAARKEFAAALDEAFPDHPRGAVDPCRDALEEVVRIGTEPRDPRLSQYREQAMVDVANAALAIPQGAVADDAMAKEVERLRGVLALIKAAPEHAHGYATAALTVEPPPTRAS